MVLDHQASVDQLMADYRRERELLVSVQRGLAAIRACAVSADRTVTVTVGARGTLTGLVIDEAAYRCHQPAELAELIMRTAGAAAARVVERTHEELAPVLPADVDPDAVLAGRADIADSEIESRLPDRPHGDDDSFEHMSWVGDGRPR